MIKAVSIAGRLPGYEHSHYEYLSIAWIEAKDERAAFALVGSNKVSKEDAKKSNIVFEGDIIPITQMIHFYQYDLYMTNGYLHRDKKKLALIDRRSGDGLRAEKGLFIPALIEAESWARQCIKDGKCDVQYCIINNILNDGYISRNSANNHMGE